MKPETDNEKIIRLTKALRQNLTEENIRLLKEQVDKCQKVDQRDGHEFPEKSWYLAFTALQSATHLLRSIKRIQEPERKKHGAPFKERYTRKYY